MEFFKSFMHGALRWFPVILSWASWLGIVMAYNKMSNPLANISWGNNSCHYFAQTVNCWETGLKFWLKRRKVRTYVSEYGNQLLLFSSLPKLNYCLRTNWLPLYEKCLHLVPNNIKSTKNVVNIFNFNVNCALITMIFPGGKTQSLLSNSSLVFVQARSYWGELL